jgi:hypothetical protein
VSIVSREARTRRTVTSTGASRPSNVRVAHAPSRGPLVTWDHVISPDESEEIVGKLAAFAPVKAIKLDAHRPRHLVMDHGADRSELVGREADGPS